FDRVRALPGVKSAAGAMLIPMTNNMATVSFEDPEHPVPAGQESSAFTSPVSPQYFSTMGIPLLEGREFTERDNMKSPLVMIVNRAFADKYFPGENVLGKKLGPGVSLGPDGKRERREIVGVVGNIQLTPTDREVRPSVYVASEQVPDWCCLYTVAR